MNTLDYVFIAIMGILAIRCLIRGFVKEVMSTAALIAGVLSGVLFCKPAGILIARLTGLTAFIEVAGFAVTFLAAFLVVKLLELTIRKMLEAVNLGGADKALGFLLGTLEGLLMVCLVLIILSSLPFDMSALINGSAIGRFLLPALVSGLGLKS